MVRLRSTPIHPGLALAALALCCAPVLAQQGHAHTHGLAQLDAAVDARTLTVRLEAPLESLLGFERAPRDDGERRRVADMVARLRAADQWVHPDPAAGCAPGEVTLESPVLGLGAAPAASEDGHADIDVGVTWRCPHAGAARFLDLSLFGAFPRLRSIEAQVAAPQGQFKRTLRPGAARLDWGR